ncbi:hypothetical protein [Priestia megaterium]|uniref:hypothetical protein n=1 Tax=Priestia megaterium TaxID=1404 RepID=UPI001F3CEB0C|nr:hypothetical protein [Priestia megaterium]MCF8890657.1 hypothetical protein [Priestia megaterium]
MEKSGHNDYQEQLKSTVQEMYPKYAQRKLLKDLELLKVVNLKKNRPSTDENILDLSTVEEQEQLTTGLLRKREVTRHIEKEEFLKSYKYAALFNVSNIEEDTFIQLQEAGKIHNFFSKDYSHDVIYDGITYKDIKPTKYSMGNVIILKFSKLLTGYIPGTGVKKQIKYPILAVYLKHLGILEVRLDQVRTYFQEDEFFYDKQITFVLKWFKENIDCDIENINLPPIIEYIGKKDQDEVNVHAQAMSLKSGGKAVLETGLNENYILPLLGELKELIKSNEELFEESPEIKMLLDKFISETESTADLPWISLIWKGKNKTKGNIVKFKHNYMNQGYTLLQYYGLQTDMEKMDNVTEYIINNKNEIDSLESAESGETGEILIDNPAL